MSTNPQPNQQPTPGTVYQTGQPAPQYNGNPIPGSPSSPAVPHTPIQTGYIQNPLGQEFPGSPGHGNQQISHPTYQQATFQQAQVPQPVVYQAESTQSPASPAPSFVQQSVAHESVIPQYDGHSVSPHPVQQVPSPQPVLSVQDQTGVQQVVQAPSPQEGSESQVHPAAGSDANVQPHLNVDAPVKQDVPNQPQPQAAESQTNPTEPMAESNTTKSQRAKRSALFSSMSEYFTSHLTAKTFRVDRYSGKLSLLYAIGKTWYMIEIVEAGEKQFISRAFRVHKASLARGALYLGTVTTKTIALHSCDLLIKGVSEIAVGDFSGAGVSELQKVT